MLDIKAALVIALGVALIVGLPGQAVAAPEAQAMRMDFSKVTSRAKAELLVARGDLVKIRFVPERFGGPAEPENTGYVPPGALVALDFVYDRISGLVKIKSITSLVVDLDYRGKSIVPSRIVYVGTGKGKQKTPITFAIDIW